jgi:hypothetical protein
LQPETRTNFDILCAMRLSSLLTLLLGTLVGAATGSTFHAQAVATMPTPAPAQSAVCGSASAEQLRTTLYFGMTRPTGAVSELEWQIFLRDEVTRRFPEGLTVWEAQGQWQSSKGSIDQERSKVLLLVHPDSSAARASVQEVIGRYRKQFDQESVLWETARVCVAS